jgi:hypothetical protein
VVRENMLESVHMEGGVHTSQRQCLCGQGLGCIHADKGGVHVIVM